MARKPISKKTRFEIFKRDGFVCQYCGSNPPKVVLHIDHIIPVVEGGTNDETNLVTSCSACNLGKSARSLTSVPASLQDRAAEIAEREEQLRGYSEIMAAQRERIEDDCWMVAKIFMGHFNLTDGIRKDNFQSIKMFVQRLGVNETMDSMDLAVARKPWSTSTCFRYFCGICWNKIKKGDGDGE